MLWFIFPTQTNKIYSTDNLTVGLNKDETIKSTYGELKLNIKSREGIFEYGSTFFCDGINDPAVIAELNSEIDKKYADKLEKILYFDIGAKDRNGKIYKNLKGEKVKIYVEVPEGWDKDRVFALFVTPDDDETFEDTQKLEVIDGVTYLSFETDHFSSYALAEDQKEHNGENEHNQSDPEEGNNGEIINDEEMNSQTAEGKGLLQTGDKILRIAIVLVVVLIISLFIIIALFHKPGRRYKK